ncbi:hypothetical protein D3C85_899880 [compost metagenome]
MGTDAPALGGALGLAAQQQGQQLVAEADAQQLVAGLVALQQEGLERLDPGVVAEGVGLAAGHQVGVELLALRRVMPLHHIEHAELCRDGLLGEQLLEHQAVAFVLIDQFGAEDIGFQNADAKRHGLMVPEA